MASELNVGGVTLDTAGVIGTVDADLRLYTTTAGHTGLRFGNGYVAPTDNAGAITTGAAELGHSSYKFSNGHFSGTVNSAGIALGNVASAAADTLDYYEEGVWTITDASGATLAFSAVVATYTRIGRTVHIQGAFTYPTTSNSNQARISLPITASATSAIGAFTSTSSTVALFLDKDGYIRGIDNGVPTNATHSGSTMYCSLTYEAA